MFCIVLGRLTLLERRCGIVKVSVKCWTRVRVENICIAKHYQQSHRKHAFVRFSVCGCLCSQSVYSLPLLFIILQLSFMPCIACVCACDCNVIGKHVPRLCVLSKSLDMPEPQLLTYFSMHIKPDRNQRSVYIEHTIVLDNFLVVCEQITSNHIVTNIRCNMLNKWC